MCLDTVICQGFEPEVCSLKGRLTNIRGLSKICQYQTETPLDSMGGKENSFLTLIQITSNISHQSFLNLTLCEIAASVDLSVMC